MHTFISTLSFCLVPSSRTIYVWPILSRRKSEINVSVVPKIRSRDLITGAVVRRDADQCDEELQAWQIVILGYRVELLELLKYDLDLILC
jgi:hypothetical protein